MSEREKAIRECAEICRKAAGYYDRGAGNAHSEEARQIGRAQAIWCAEEIERLLSEPMSIAAISMKIEEARIEIQQATVALRAAMMEGPARGGSR